LKFLVEYVPKEEGINVRTWKGKQIGLRTFEEKFVSSRTDDAINFSSQLGDSETLTVETTGDFLAFKTARGSYICAASDNKVTCVKTCDAYCKFSVVAAPSNSAYALFFHVFIFSLCSCRLSCSFPTRYGLKTSRSTYLSASGGAFKQGNFIPVASTLCSSS
jgi:hypothetical protein